MSSLSIHFPGSAKKSKPSLDLSELFSGNVSTVDANGDASLKLTDSSGVGKLIPLGGVSWSPDGSGLAFSASKLGAFLRSEEEDIYVVGSDGLGLRRLTRLGNASLPVFSADGKTVYFERQKAQKIESHPDLTTINRRVLSKKNGNDSGKTFAVLAPAASSIWAINIDETGLHRVTPLKSGVSEAPSSVSPLTGDLAFSHAKCRQRKCTYSARLFSITTGTVTILANHAVSPVFSPDGQKLALDSYQDHNWRKHSPIGPTPELYVRTLATGEMRRLTFSRGVTDGPASWDPSGSRLAYLRFSLKRDGVMEINPDGTCATPLPSLQGTIFGTSFLGLAWQPGSDRGAGPAVC